IVPALIRHLKFLFLLFPDQSRRLPGKLILRYHRIFQRGPFRLFDPYHAASAKRRKKRRDTDKGDCFFHNAASGQFLNMYSMKEKKDLLQVFSKMSIILSLTVVGRKNRCIPYIYWAAAIFIVVSN